MRNKEIIPIFFAVDDNYAKYLCVTLRSLIDNSSERYEYQINILIDSLSEENTRMLKDMQTENINIEFVNVSLKLKSICKKLHLRDYYTKATYYRFFIPEMFPQYKKGLYLDCDIVLTKDVSYLYHTILGNNLVGAITEEIITDIECFARYSEIVLNIPKNNYFNAGILVMNLSEMRKIHIENKFAELLEQKTYRVAQDQDYLNVLCQNKVTYINKKWNKTPMPDSNPLDIPYLVHYKINFKPWKYDDVIYGDLFWKYAEKTPVYGILIAEKQSYTNEQKATDSAQYEALVELANSEVNAELHNNAKILSLTLAEAY